MYIVNKACISMGDTIRAVTVKPCRCNIPLLLLMAYHETSINWSKNTVPVGDDRMDSKTWTERSTASILRIWPCHHQPLGERHQGLDFRKHSPIDRFPSSFSLKVACNKEKPGSRSIRALHSQLDQNLRTEIRSNWFELSKTSPCSGVLKDPDVRTRDDPIQAEENLQRSRTRSNIPKCMRMRNRTHAESQKLRSRPNPSEARYTRHQAIPTHKTREQGPASILTPRHVVRGLLFCGGVAFLVKFCF